MNLDEELSKMIYDICETFYFEGTDPEDIEKEEIPVWVNEIKQAFIKAGWTKPDPTRILGDE